MIVPKHMVCNLANGDLAVLQQAILPYLIRSRQAAQLATFVAYFVSGTADTLIWSFLSI